MREETEEGRERDKQRQGGEKDWRAEGMRVRKSLRCMGDVERDRESRLSWPTLHKERTASLKVTLKHTFAEKLSHLNLAELAVCTCRTVRCGVGVCRYQMTCNPSCLSSMCLSLFFSLYTHSQTRFSTLPKPVCRSANTGIFHSLQVHICHLSLTVATLEDTVLMNINLLETYPHLKRQSIIYKHFMFYSHSNGVHCGYGATTEVIRPPTTMTV